MSWEAIGAVAESLGALGVILTLAYLAVQIRHNTRAIESQRHDERTKALREITLFTAEADWLWSITEKLQAAMKTDEPIFHLSASRDEWKGALQTLTPIEQGKFAALQLTQWNHYQDLYFQHDQGLLQDSLFDAYCQQVQRVAPLWLALGFSQNGLTDYDRFVREAAVRDRD